MTHSLAVPLAALLGIPVYLNTDGSLPLVATLMDGGMGAGPALAFLVTGAGTSIGAISGMLVIAHARVVALTIGLLFAGAVLLGWMHRYGSKERHRLVADSAKLLAKSGQKAPGTW